MWRDPRWCRQSCRQCSGLVTLATWDKLLSGMWPVQSVIPRQQVLSHLINHAECCLLLWDCLVDVTLLWSFLSELCKWIKYQKNILKFHSFFLNSEIMNWFMLYFLLVCEHPPAHCNVCVSARLQHCGFSADIHCPLPCYEGCECETVLFLIQWGGKYILWNQNLHSLITINNCKWEHHLTWRAWFEFW